MNFLTIMSFCFLGELTFLGASYKTIAQDFWLILLTAISFMAWLVAFFVGVFFKNRKFSYYAVPGFSDGLRFLPSATDMAQMRSQVKELFDADEFFMRKTLARVGIEISNDVAYDDLLYAYQMVFRAFDIESAIEKTTWLANLVYLERAETENLRRLGSTYRVLYGLFAVNVVLVFLVAILCMVMVYLGMLGA